MKASPSVVRGNGRAGPARVLGRWTFLGLVLPALLLAGCGGVRYLVVPEADRGPVLEDGDARLEFAPDPRAGRIRLRLINKTAEAIRLRWDESRYVETTGTPGRLFVEPWVRLIRDGAHPYTTVRAGRSLQVSLIPASRVHWATIDIGRSLEEPRHQEFLAVRKVGPLFPPERSRAEQLVGATFGADVVLEIGQTLRRYSIRFRIADLES